VCVDKISKETRRKKRKRKLQTKEKKKTSEGKKSVTSRDNHRPGECGMNAGQQKENGHRKDIQKTRDGRIFRMSQTVHPTLLSWLFFSTAANLKDEAKG